MQFDHIINDCYNVLDDLDNRKIKYDCYVDGIKVFTNIGTVAISNGLVLYVTYYDILWIIKFGYTLQ